MNTFKDAKNTVIQGITTKVEKAMSENNGKVPYGFVAREVATVKAVFPNLKINRDHINYMLDKRKKERTTAIQHVVPLDNHIVTLPAVPKISGRPTGSTEKRKRSKSLNCTATKMKFVDYTVRRKSSTMLSTQVVPKLPTSQLEDWIQSSTK